MADARLGSGGSVQSHNGGKYGIADARHRRIVSRVMRNFERPGRSVVMSTHGMAATSHPLSSLVAVDILKSGGNAIDAAIAACATQCVVEPGSTGIGGDCFALFARPGDPVRGFNGSGRTPVAATAERFASLGMSVIDRHSPHAVTVPGAIDAWATLSRDHGSLPFKDLLRPAITLAREGYAVTPRSLVRLGASGRHVAARPPSSSDLPQRGCGSCGGERAPTT